MSGTLGDQLTVRKTRGGKTIVTNKPTFDENREFTPAQMSNQGRFQDATAYAKSAQRETVYVELARGTAKCPYNVAISDWYHAPEILELDLGNWGEAAGGRIRIKARDNVQVTRVSVTITDEAGAVLDQGLATQADELWWEYATSTTGGKVEAAAYDLPGNITRMVREK